jgi:hypothetical protein
VLLPLESFEAAEPRLASAFWLTSWPELSVSPAEPLCFSLAPAELAVDWVSFEELPSAANVTAPPAFRLRFSVE